MEIVIWIILFHSSISKIKPPSFTRDSDYGGFMSYSSDVKYLSNLISDYKKKLKDKFWEGFHDFIKDELIKCDRQLYLIKEQELCQKLNSTQTTNSISTFLSISQS